MKAIFAAGTLALGIGTAGIAAAQDAAAPEAEAKPATFDVVEVKLCTGTDKREATGVKTNFATGEKLYLRDKRKLMYAEWHLSNCQAELDEFRNRDDSLRRKKSEAGKEGGRGRTK